MNDETGCQFLFHKMTFDLHINGIVQGVGFRPMVYQLAKDMQLNGYVKNGGDGVHVCFNATKTEAELFLKKIKRSFPPLAKVISVSLNQTEEKIFTGFSILVEEDNGNRQVLIAPDIALCDNCRKELYDKSNHRYRYPFITCTQCGPRYSIIQSLPYERNNTAMECFGMCDNCLEEYNEVTDRRFFSQTNSCNDCGIELSMYDNKKQLVEKGNKEVLQSITHLLKEGNIIAIKGVGGYLLLCDAANEDAIKLLRQRKHRPAKPFAVLYPGIQSVKNDFAVSNKELDLLQGEEAPVVLLYPKQEAFDYFKNIAPGLKRLGIMLPYSPLLDLIATGFGKPLIATSANISGSPIIYKEEDAHDLLSGIVDYVIGYNRDIVIPQDDSVVQVSKYSSQQVILRRSRGYAPSFLAYEAKKNETVLATGALMKSSFALSVSSHVFVSQFLGSGENYESQQMYKNTLQHWLKMYDVKPSVILADKHPGYFSHQYAAGLSRKSDTGIKFIQHHEAHFAAVLAENNLLHADEPVLGVIWDGTGFGNDGNIWGGEFFRYENNEMLRCYHFNYFPVIAGNKMAMEPRLSALCASTDAWPQPAQLKEKFTEKEWNNYQSLIRSADLYTSSAGRIFDAVASALDLCDKQSYEGEAAMYLQALAEEYVEENGFAMDTSYFREGSHYYRIPTATLMQELFQDIKSGKAKKYIAAKFHYSLACLVDIVAKHLQVEKICFSGGVFQNTLLVDWIAHDHGNRYRLYFHKDLSPNDENISFGQLVYYDNGIDTVLSDKQNNLTNEYGFTQRRKEAMPQKFS